MNLEFKDATEVMIAFKSLLEYSKKSGYAVADIPYYTKMIDNGSVKVVTNFAYLYLEMQSKKLLTRYPKPETYLEFTTKRRFDALEKASIFDLIASNKVNNIRVIESMYSFGDIDSNWISLINWSLLSVNFKGAYEEDYEAILTKVKKSISLLKNHYEYA